jgi:vanillate O-demethylase ferredoxin subunit
MHYCGRTSDRLAFTPELKQFGDKIQVYIDSGPDDQKLDTNSLLSNADAGQHLYVWGPNDFMDFVVKSAENDARNTECVHLERFGAEVTTDGAPFTVFTRKSGKTFDELPDESISKKLADHGIHVQVSSQSGVCGSCLTGVLKGTPGHRDLVKTDLEKAFNTQITVCCSRWKRKQLVLDLLPIHYSLHAGAL